MGLIRDILLLVGIPMAWFSFVLLIAPKIKSEEKKDILQIVSGIVGMYFFTFTTMGGYWI